MSLKALSFDKEKQRDDTKRDNIEFPINGEIYYAYKPSTNSIGLFFAAQGTKNVAHKLAGAITFLEENLEPAAHALIMRGVANDAIDLDIIIELVLEIIEEFSKNPTTSSTASTASRRGSGRESTANSRRPASTRVSSTPRASAV
jgi:hypothetical protein